MDNSARNTTSRRTLLTATGAVGIAGLAGCTGAIGGNGGVAIGGKDFTEQHVLSNLAITALEENTDLDVVDETGLGGTMTNFEALTADEIDLYWEYTGTMWLAIPPEQDGIIEDPDELYDEAAAIMNDEHDVAVLEKAPLNNTYQILATSEWYGEHDVESLSDFAEFANEGHAEDTEIVLGPEFQEREDDGWPALLDHYGFTDEAIETLDENTETVDEDVVYAAVGEQGDGDIGMGFATDPRIPLFDLQILADDENFFPTYNAAPIVRNDTLDDHPEIADELDEISPLLDDDTIAGLNMEVAEEGRDVSAVAEEFLADQGLI